MVFLILLKENTISSRWDSEYRTPDEILTDHGTQFVAFKELLKENGDIFWRE